LKMGLCMGVRGNGFENENWSKDARPHRQCEYE
jgi:hypothetical protein